MTEDLKTIKELADELGVSKTAISKKVSNEERKLWFAKKGNRFLINENGQKAIKSRFLNDNENKKMKTNNKERKLESQTKNQTPQTDNNQQIDTGLEKVNQILSEQLADLIATKNKQFVQIEAMQKLLDQQQQLSLQDKQLIKELRQQLALNSPVEKQETESQEEMRSQIEQLKEEKQTLQEEKEHLAKIAEDQVTKLTTRKWYHFWKK